MYIAQDEIPVSGEDTMYQWSYEWRMRLTLSLINQQEPQLTRNRPSLQIHSPQWTAVTSYWQV